MKMNPQGGVAHSVTRAKAGIEVSKQPLEVRLGTEDFRVDNPAAGWAEWIAKFNAAEVNLIGVEATGGYARCGARGVGGDDDSPPSMGGSAGGRE